MKKILHGLYNGDIIPWERRNSNSETQRALLQKIESEERYFMEKMSLDDCSRFQTLSSLHSELSIADENNIFSYGFTLQRLNKRITQKRRSKYSFGQGAKSQQSLVDCKILQRSPKLYLPAIVCNYFVKML